MSTSQSKIQCVILAGGLATRMRPLTEKIPKALIPIQADKPFAEYQLKWLAGHGVTDVVFSIGYKGEMIRDAIGDGSRFGLKIVYVDEGSELKGTAGALRKAYDQGVLDNNFLVTYGDSFLPVDFGAIFETFKKTGLPALMAVFRNEEKFDTSNVCYEVGRVTLYDKWIKEKPTAMKYIDYGLSAFSQDLIVREVKAGEKADLADLFHRLSAQGKLAGYEVTQRFYEIGSPAGLADFRDLLGKSATP
jgi:NDP-sugar pyrophosphorylase family protein